jgi:hypothetical protein
MNVKVIEGGDESFRAMVYGTVNNGVREYLKNNMNNVLENTANLSKSFIDNTKALYEKYSSTEAINRAKGYLYNIGTKHFKEDVIQYLNYNNVQDANLIMQRYIMAEPTVFNLYKKNLCNGFQDTYLDNYDQHTKVEDTLEYQQVMDGVLQFDKDGEGYIEHISHSGDDLDHMDKMAILDTWDNVRLLIHNQIDPTDKDKGEL